MNEIVTTVVILLIGVKMLRCFINEANFEYKLLKILIFPKKIKGYDNYDKN